MQFKDATQNMNELLPLVSMPRKITIDSFRFDNSPNEALLRVINIAAQNLVIHVYALKNGSRQCARNRPFTGDN